MLDDVNNADLVVVGSGGAGATIAGEAARAGRRVTLIEAGGPLGAGRLGRHLRNENPADEELNRFAEVMVDGMVNHGFTDRQAGDVTAFHVVHAVGGRMTLWFNNCPEPHPAERNSAIPDEAWPDLLDRARALMHVTQTLGRRSERQRRLLAIYGEMLPDLPPGRGAQPMPTAATETEENVWNFRGADDLLLGDEDALSPQVDLLADTVALRLIFAGDRVDGVEVGSLDGWGRRTIRGENYVVAGGTIGTPQLLFASGFDHPALGRFMMDHPAIGTRVPLSSTVLGGVPADDPGHSLWIPYSEPRRWHTQLSRTPYLPELADVPGGKTSDLFSFGGIEPNPDNRLDFDPERPDGLGLPSYTSHLNPSAEDWAGVEKMVGDHFSLFRAIARDDRGWQPQLFPWGASMHLIGTNRMGAGDDGTSVADSHSQVWGFENLYVAGNGILSERSTCNPTLQTVAIALRCVDHILDREPASSASAAGATGTAA